MRIVHTSDWHVGLRWKSRDRLPEMEVVLRHLGDYVEREKIDLVLHTGDVFDGRNPSGDAEQLVNRFFVRLHRLGVPMVVIAGNHDDPDRFDARGFLTELASVRLIGRPRSAAHGGTFGIATRSGERASIAALPFASVGQWIDALQIAGDLSAAHHLYARMFRAAVQDLCGAFEAGAVKLLMAHTHLQGAVYGTSERPVHIGEEWAASPEDLAADAHYIALGHIHLPQQIPGGRPAHYAGSPIQMDFGEAGQAKSFVVVDAAPHRPAQIERVPYEGGWPLRHLRGTLPELEAEAPRHRERCWLWVSARLDQPDPGISQRLIELFPRAVTVDAEYPEREERRLESFDRRVTPRERYTAYHREVHGEEVAPDVIEAFDALHAEASRHEE